MSEADPIVVSGVGAVAPLGADRDRLWRGWCSGASGIRAVDEATDRTERAVDPDPLPPIGRAGLIDDFTPRSQIQSRGLRRMDWCARIVVAAARQALEDAGGDAAVGEARDRVAVVVGSQFGNQRETEAYMKRVFERGMGAGQPMLFPNLVLNAPAGYAAMELDLHGPNLSVSDHEVSGEAALGTAVDLLDGGLADLVLAGGGDEFGAVLLRALRERRLLAASATPGGVAARESLGRVVPGEGAAVLTLERRSRARARGARAYAEVEAAEVRSIPSDPYRIPSPDEAASHLATAVDELASGTVDAWVALDNGIPARRAIDTALGRLLGGNTRPLPLRERVGDWGSIGALSAALGALALADEAAETERPRRILVPGVGRGGAMAAVVLARAND